MLASLAVAKPLIYRRPRVAILGTGDEIVDIDQPDLILSGRKIASSNSHTLRALVRLAGGEPIDLGIARDTPESLQAHLARAREADLLITSAGISVGEHDCVRAVLRNSAPISSSGSCACAPVRRSASACSGSCRGSASRATR